MPPVAIKYIVSFSSQDDKHPVSNLVKSDGFKKWLSHPQERSGQIEAVLQLEQACVITYIDIGSIWCATLEIKVGRSDWPAGREFESLAYTGNLMTPVECITNKNPNKTQMFSADLFCPDVAKKEWDRIKVICGQPYKKMVQFGLSFLRVKTSQNAAISTSCEKRENTLVSTSVKDIQKHFLEKLENGGNKANNQLKSRLLKIAASSENGIEHDDSLSRTAKLVLAASGIKPKSYTASSPVPSSEKTGMYSSRVEQMFAPQFDEEVDEFLKQLVIDPTELDSVTMADVRHKFERKKRRKLTKHEKKIFIQKATKHLTSAFKDKTNQNAEKENMNTKVLTTAMPCVNKDANENRNISKSKDIQRPINSVPLLNDIEKRPGVKRKLDTDAVTPPRKKVVKENASPLTMMQKLKSYENQSCVEKKDLIGQLKKSKQTGPIANCVTSPSTPFQYKGLRGRESDFDSQMVDTVSPAGINNFSTLGKEDFSASVSEKCSFSSFINTSTPPKQNDYGLDSSSDDDILYTEAEVSRGRRGQGRGRGGKRGGGRGKGRGRGKKVSTQADNCSDLMDGVCTPSTRSKGRGRGRGRGGRKGRGRGAAGGTPVQKEEVTVVQEEMRAVRGFTRCSGCRDYFGDALLYAHEQRCAALKSSGATVPSCNNQMSKQNSSTPAPQVKQRPSTSSLETRPTSFIKCDGCNDYFGAMLLSVHQQKCVRWKNLNKTDSSVTACDSPWLSARKQTSAVGQTDMNPSISSSGQRLGTSTGSVSSQGQRSNDEQMRSPPWLLAAEKRLQQQRQQPQNLNTSQISSKSFPSCNGEVSSTAGCSNTSLNSSITSSCNTSPAVESQQWMLEKYERLRDTEDTQSQSILQKNGNSIRNMSGGRGQTSHLESGANGTSRRHNSSVTRNRFSAFEISDDSDDYDDEVDDNDEGFNDNRSALNTEGSSVTADGKVGDTVHVECPLCGDFYPSYIIEMHASTCYL